MTSPFLYISWLLLLAETTFQNAVFVNGNYYSGALIQVRLFNRSIGPPSVNFLFRNRHFPELKMLSEVEGVSKLYLFPIMSPKRPFPRI